MVRKAIHAKPDKRDAILEAMLDLVVERGFHNAPMSLLARRSGASPGVIYHYFPSKDELIRAVYQRVAAIKHDVILEDYSDSVPAREAMLQLWLNTYRFYRKYRREARFLDQYLNSPFCSTAGKQESADGHPAMARIYRLFRPRRQGGILKDLPMEAIESLTLGLAAALAKARRSFSESTLREIAETVWTAIADE